ncbi:MAG: Ig domain-containing protein [Bacteroidaceae bacterium]|nr:Ig domain-containing protein [Bacteroidaceae bacterium]
MKKILSFLLFLAVALLPSVTRAQIINGDLNHNNALDVGDVTMVIDGYLTGETEMISANADPYEVDNSRLVGTWYKSKRESITFNADGTTDYIAGCTYKFRPFQGTVLFYNANGVPVSRLRIEEITHEYLVVGTSTGSDVVVYTSARPVQKVTSITLSKSTLEFYPDCIEHLTATVLPADADNLAVEWHSSDEHIASVTSDGTVKAISEGTAIITCAATDESGVTATCKVTVKARTYHNGYEYVDLGLSVKWATMNIGASSPEDYGDYFAWGETEPKDTYNWSTYKWCNGSSTTLTKYCLSSDYGTVDKKTTLELEDDAAHANWGGTWRMPTSGEIEELRNKCRSTWTTHNGVNGCKVVSKINGNSIFLPAAGYRSDDSLNDAGIWGYNWSSSLYDYSTNGWFLYFSSTHFSPGVNYRYSGRSVRPVCP